MRKKITTIMLCLFVLISAFVCASLLGKCANDKEKTEDSEIAEYSGNPYIELNDNKPEFTKSEVTKESYESYGELDDLGRCTPAMACLGKDLMPTKDRESISMVKPTGWEQEKYPGLVDSDPPYIYNRCHMIGFQLTGENANEKNLITGTRYMNVEGMLPFENEVADYIRSTGNHVMYRVTPVFEGKNLLCDGIKMEALSVEDNGKGVSFNVFCYNVQPGVIIDYSDGSNKLDKNYKADKEASEDNSASGKSREDENNSTSGKSREDENNSTSEKNSGEEKTTFTLDEFTSTENGDASESVTRSAPEVTHSYVGNKNSNVFHYPDCDSVSDMKEKNKVFFYDVTRDEVIDSGFRPCQRCKP